MTRRALLLAALTPAMRADSADQVWDVIASLASALSAGNAAEFMDAFDPAIKDYQRLRGNIAALLRDAEVQAAIDLVRNDGDDRARIVESDWLLRITQRADAAASLRRRQRLSLKLEKQGRKWRIVSLEPAALFDPPRFD